jgi:NADH-quinone oxidoreductase subunit L
MHDIAWLLLALPLLGFAVNGLLGQRLGRAAVSWIGPGVVLVAFVVALLAFARLQGGSAACAQYCDEVYYTWATAGTFVVKFGLLIDPLASVMLLVVTGVGFLIHVYSVGYMGDDPHYSRFFTYMNLFIFSMLLLVLADDFLFLLVGWGLVGLSSYLLIGFWLERPSAVAAARKAFVMNVIGDAGMMVALFLIFKTFHTLNYDPVFSAAQGFKSNDLVITVICLTLLIGAVAKSAQIPLHTWLPDAMEGPTPVSALIHAATMVTAGVYLVARCYVLFLVSPFALGVVAIIGAVTAVFAATIGTAQYDIKRVLAYSTMSQIGYMFLGAGVAAFTSAMFHLVTHAFFKALLFMGAGSVIHAMHDEQDIRKMGQLRAPLPRTWAVFLVGCLAISGIFPLAGFWSKDEILGAVFSAGSWHLVLYVVGLLTAGVTAFYMFRLFFITFHGQDNVAPDVRAHLHEAPQSMYVPMAILAVLSAIGGLINAWGFDAFTVFLRPVFTRYAAVAGRVVYPSDDATQVIVLAVVALVVVLAGIFIAYNIWFAPGATRPVPASLVGLQRLFNHKYYVDELYDDAIVRPTEATAELLADDVDRDVIDGLVNGTAGGIAAVGSGLGLWETGYVRLYALSILAGAAVIVGFVIWHG